MLFWVDCNCLICTCSDTANVRLRTQSRQTSDCCCRACWEAARQLAGYQHTGRLLTYIFVFRCSCGPRHQWHLQKKQLAAFSEPVRFAACYSSLRIILKQNPSSSLSSQTKSVVQVICVLRLHHEGQLKVVDESSFWFNRLGVISQQSPAFSKKFVLKMVLKKTSSSPPSVTKVVITPS